MRAQVKNLSAMTHNSVHTAKVVMKQNKFPSNLFRSVSLFFLHFYTPWDIGHPQQIQLKPKSSLPTSALYNSKVLLAHEAPRLVQQV